MSKSGVIPSVILAEKKTGNMKEKKSSPSQKKIIGEKITQFYSYDRALWLCPTYGHAAPPPFPSKVVASKSGDKGAKCAE